MNINSLKLGFLEYLKKKIGNSGSAVSGSNNINSSIFLHINEFKDYMAQKLNGQENSGNIIMSIISDALKDKQALNALDTDTNGDISKDEINIFMNQFSDMENVSQEQLNQVSSQFLVQNLLDKTYENASVIKALDTDGNGKLNGEEKKKFEKYIKNTYGEVSGNTITQAVNQITDRGFLFDSPATGENSTLTSSPNNHPNSAPVSPNSSQGTSNLPNNSNSSSPTGTNQDTNQPKSTGNNTSYENMSLTELENAKSSKQNEINEARKNINTVNSEFLEKEQDAQKEYDNVISEILENNEAIKEQIEERRNTNLQNISDTETQINNTESDINTTSGEISAKDSEITSVNSQIGALDSQISSLKGQKKNGTDEKTKKINDAIDAQITKAEAEKSRLENTVLPGLNDELNALNDKKNALEQSLDTLNSQLDEYKQEKANIEQEIYNLCSEEEQGKITDAKTTYDQEMSQIAADKTAAITDAQSKLDTLQDELDAINNQINVKKTEDIKNTYSVEEGLTFDEMFDGSVKGYEAKTLNYNGRNYVAYIPKDLDPNEPVALALHLHGQWENGDKTQRLKNIGFGLGLSNLEKLNSQKTGLDGQEPYIMPKAIFLLPQTNGSWATDKNVDYLDGLVSNFIDNSGYNIDQNKVALSGHSMGTHGAIYYLEHSANKSLYKKLTLESVTFSDDIERLENLGIPTTIFTGTSDGNNCKQSAEIAEALKNSGRLKNVTSRWINASHGDIRTKLISGDKREEVDSNNNNIPDFFEAFWK